MAAPSEFERIFFDLTIEDGWPPVSVESVWAMRTPAPDEFEHAERVREAGLVDYQDGKRA